jgi:hypothetical protein
MQLAGEQPRQLSTRNEQVISDHPGIQICGIAAAVPERCIDQAVTPTSFLPTRLNSAATKVFFREKRVLRL